MEKLLLTKKKKLNRDLTDYANKCAYPRPSCKLHIPQGDVTNQVEQINATNLAVNNNNGNNQDNFPGQRQGIRRSPRFNNNNAGVSNSNQENTPVHVSRDNNQTQDQPMGDLNQQDSRDFHQANNIRATNRIRAQTANNTRNKRRGRRR
ncbi:putative uncharacterized protein DDB_G0283431 [Protopterus annectens]|uniref:putative uncharacterized protein DDB_G0283431 n=1 Tax=Protopterus annectens TaxID=7888 RepID=UPI001CFC23E3|nr:putative uncharacterized protein DDB_G0283431 [Protopterus annectens]